jgi:hypothetical protein
MGKPPPVLSKASPHLAQLSPIMSTKQVPVRPAQKGWRGPKRTVFKKAVKTFDDKHNNSYTGFVAMGGVEFPQYTQNWPRHVG